ncbi:hypothetical protein HanIR_Chr15g0733311 [Helianthus annuus]|nr:hypothetical protein HanIR_Chr15g0733311 [Helianthus annuus]
MQVLNSIPRFQFPTTFLHHRNAKMAGCTTEHNCQGVSGAS